MNNITDKQLRKDKALAEQYLRDRQQKGYIQSQVIKEILEASIKAGEEVTDRKIEGWLYRQIKRLDLKFVNGNDIKSKKNTSSIKAPQNSNTKVPKNSNSKVIHNNNTEEVQCKKEVENMTEKLDKIISLLENKREDVTTSNALIIEADNTVPLQTSIKINEEVWKQFKEFCKGYSYKNKDLVAKALIEFMEKYKQ